MKTILLYILFIGITFCGLAQEKRFLRGRVNDVDSAGIHVVNVLNLTHPIGTMTNTNGDFGIFVHIGDTLLFSAVQYKNVKVDVTKAMFDDGFVEVVMDFDNITLHDIVLTNGRSMLDTTAKDTGDVNLSLPFSIKPIVRPYTERKLDYLKGGVLGFMNELNGKADKVREIMAHENEQKRFEGVKDRFSEQFYLDLGIPKDEIYSFVDFYYPEAKEKGLLRSGFQFELIEFIKAKALKYIPVNNPKSDTTQIKQ